MAALREKTSGPRAKRIPRKADEAPEGASSRCGERGSGSGARRAVADHGDVLRGGDRRRLRLQLRDGGGAVGVAGDRTGGGERRDGEQRGGDERGGLGGEGLG